MPFMVRYAGLFEKSNIVEKIIPRSIKSAKDFESNYPDLLIKGSSQVGPDMEVSKEDEYEQADLDAVNQVKSKVIKILGHS